MLGLIKGVSSKTQKINEQPLEEYIGGLINQEKTDRVLFTKRRNILTGKLPKKHKKKQSTKEAAITVSKLNTPRKEERPSEGQGDEEDSSVSSDGTSSENESNDSLKNKL